MRRWGELPVVLVGIIAALGFTSGCTTLVKVGEDQSSTDDSLHGADGGAGGGGGSAAGAASAIALLRRQIPDASSGSSGSSSAAAGGGPALDPDDLFVMIGNRGLTCANPYGTTGCGRWLVSVVFPPAMQAPGVYQLSSPELTQYSMFSVQGPDRGNGDCWGGGGSFLQGTVEIVGIDARQVVVRFNGTDTSDVDVNGAHTAARCP